MLAHFHFNGCNCCVMFFVGVGLIVIAVAVMGG